MAKATSFDDLALSAASTDAVAAGGPHPAPAPAPSSASPDWLSGLVHLLYNQNPFYLIGTLLILVGLQQSLGNRPGLETSGLLVGLLALYTLFIAGAAALVVRVGQVWDDARTILLVIVLMFFTLSTSLDVHLLSAPLGGTLLLVAGLAFSIGLSETLLRGLRMHLAPQYRGPYYAMLVLLFVYPAALAWLSRLQFDAARSMALLAFPVLAGVLLLTLLPAARRPAFAEPTSGTPWKWPYYPWSLFVYLTVGFAIRSWSLTIAFESAAGHDACFRPYFLLPLAVAWGALVLEMGRARKSRGAMAAGLALPLVGLVLGFTGPAANPVALEFDRRLVTSIGSPSQIAIWSMLAFYAWAWKQDLPVSEGFLIVLGLVASIVGRETVDWWSLSRPQPLVLAALAGGIVLQAIRYESTWRALLGGTMVALGASYAAPHLADANMLWFWRWHGPLIVLLGVTILFNDTLASELRQLAWRAAPVLAWVAAVVYPWMMPGATTLTCACYLALVLLVSAGLWNRQKEVGPLAAVLVTAAANVLAHLQHAYVLLQRTALAEGLAWLAAGLLVVVLGLSISLLKMGLAARAREWLEQLNAALGGGKPAPAES